MGFSRLMDGALASAALPRWLCWRRLKADGDGSDHTGIWAG
jgi:hypothetical protein